MELRLRDNSQKIYRAKDMQKTVSRGWKYATIFLVLAVSSLVWERHEKSNACKTAFHYSYLVTVQDADNGKVLKAIIKHPVMSTSDLFPQTTGSLAYPDGSVRIGGMAYTARTYTFGLPGYRSEKLTIKPNSPFTDTVTIKLKRLTVGEKSDGPEDDIAQPTTRSDTK